MHRYFKVEAVQQKGVKLEERSFSPSQPQIPSGKLLVAVCDLGQYKRAPEVTNPSDYRELYAEYDQGQLDIDGLYLLDKEKAGACL